MTTSKNDPSQAPHGPFDLLIAGLAAQTQVGLGLRPDPISKAIAPNLPMARQSIDMLGALEEKTKGNLTPEEARLLGAILADLRLAYVRASR